MMMWAEPLGFAVIGPEGNLPLVWDLTTPFVPPVDVESLPEDLESVNEAAGEMGLRAEAAAERGTELHEGYEVEQMFFPMDELSDPEEGCGSGVALAEDDALLGANDLLLHNRPESSSEGSSEDSAWQRLTAALLQQDIEIESEERHGDNAANPPRQRTQAEDGSSSSSEEL